MVKIKAKYQLDSTYLPLSASKSIAVKLFSSTGNSVFYVAWSYSRPFASLSAIGLLFLRMLNQGPSEFPWSNMTFLLCV